MLRSLTSPSDGPNRLNEADGAPEQEAIEFGQLLAAARRMWRGVALCMMLGIAAGVAYLLTATPRYQAVTQLLLNENKGRPLDDTAQVAQIELSTSDTNVLSQVELIKSDRLALEVVDKLDLTHNPAFAPPPPSLLGRLLDTVRSTFDMGSAAPAVPTDERQIAAGSMQRNLSVDRVGRTLVLTVGFEAKDPELAAKIANSYADAYLNDGLESNFDAVERTSAWLHARLTELEERAKRDDAAVQKYRSDHGLIASNGKLVAEQQLSEINSQLILAQADSARAKARSDQFESLLEEGSPESVMSAAVSTNAGDNSVVVKLRSRYLDTTTRLADLIKRWGERHPEVAKLRAEAAGIQGQLVAELRRFSASYANDYAVAQSREASLRSNLDRLVGTNDASNQTQVELRALQQRADASRDLYQSFLHRGEQTTQQRSFPVQAARIISAASIPTVPSSPKKALILALGAIGGLVIGVLFGLARDKSKRVFTRLTDVTTVLGLKGFGLIPRFGRVRIAKNDVGSTLFPQKSLAAYVRRLPMSLTAETLRRVKISADLHLGGAEPKIMGVVSALPDEGKSSVSAGLAQLLAASGARTLLIDADQRGLGLSSTCMQPIRKGLLDILFDQASPVEAMLVDERSGLVFMPARRHAREADASNALASSAMRDLLAALGREFDYIILDLPPLGPVADARAVARYVDAMLMVVRWGKTPRQVVQSILGREPEVMSKMLGAVLNNVDMRGMRLYSASSGEERHMGSYEAYYHSRD